HAETRLVEVAFGNAVAKHRHRAGVDRDRHRKCLGDRIGGDIVVGGPDAAGGEDVVVSAAEGVHRRYDLVLHVRHDAHFAKIDPDGGKALGEVADVLVLGAAGEDLIADDQQGGRD